MTTYNRGDVILVPFPFSNQSATKKRPAAVISSNAYNTVYSDLIIIAITSKIEDINTDIECLIQHWEAAGLLKLSSVKPAISTIENKLILKKLGTLTPADLESVKIFITKLFGL